MALHSTRPNSLSGLRTFFLLSYGGKLNEEITLEIIAT